MIMQKCKIMLLSLVLALVSCKNEYVIDIDNVSELSNAILESEKYMKKIEVLSTYPNHYVEFGDLEKGTIGLLYSTLNYDPNDSTREGRHNPNWQSNVDTLQNIPGLKAEEWQDLKRNLKILGKYGIYWSGQQYYNDGKFQFYYYLYKLHKYNKIGPLAYLAVLPESQTQTEDFKRRFIIMDRKDNLYFLISSDRN